MYKAVMFNFHLVILKKFYLDKIRNRSKTVESRLTKTAIPPFGCVAIGDILIFKQSSGPVCAVAQVADVQQFSNLTPAKITALKNQYNHLILGEDEYWNFKSDSKFAVLCWLKNVKTIDPVRIYKQDWRAWVVLKKPDDFGLLDKLASSGYIIQ